MVNPLILPAPGYDWDHQDEARRNFALKKAMDSKLERADVVLIVNEAIAGIPGGGGGGAATFIGDSPPASPVAGQLWWESDTGNLHIYFDDGTSSQWVIATVGTPGPEGPEGQPTFVSDSPPASPAAGQLWWESDSGNLFVWYDDGTSAQWVQAVVGPSVAS